MSDSITMREALLLDIAQLKRERDEAREALQKVASMAHGNADKTVCLIMLSGIQRVVTEALKSQEAAK